MHYIDELRIWLQILIPLAAGIPFTRCLIAIIQEEDQAAMYRRRLRNVILFVIIAEVAFTVLDMIKNYFI